MNTRNDVMKEKTSRRLRPIALLAMAMLTASVAVAGCSKPDSNRDGRTSGGNTIKCGTTTCNKLTQKCENEKCVPKAGTILQCGTSSCNPATQECVDGNKCVNKCGDTVCSDAQNCVGGQCVAKGGRTQCGSTTCDDNTQECKNGTCVGRTIECGTGASRRLCDEATQECRDGNCAKKGSKVTCDPDFQVKQGDVCIIKNAGDGTCSSSPCTGSDICQNGQCVSVCKFCDESANYVGCFSVTGQQAFLKCEYDSASGKYMAENKSTGTQVECQNPACGQKATPNSEGHSPCYTQEYGDCDLEGGDVCVTIGNRNECAKGPKQQPTEPEFPCGQKCGTGKICNTTTKQCETNSSAQGSCEAPPDVTRLNFLPDTTSGKSYRSVATFNATIGRHSASVGGFEAAMNTCGSPQASNTDYQVFLIHLDTYSNISVYSDTTSDESFDGFSVALFSTTGCSSNLMCERDFRIAKGNENTQQGSARTLPAGDYYLVVKNENVSNTAAQGKSWRLQVVKETYAAKGECTGPEKAGATYTCDSDKKAYTLSCETLTIAPPSFAPNKITCLTTTTDDPLTTAQGCYQEPSSAPSCYGVTCDKPITVDGSTKRTITFADLKKGDRGKSANYANPSFTDNSCTPTPQPTGLQFTYVLKVTNLLPDSRVTVSLPPTGKVFGYETSDPNNGGSASPTPPLASAAAIVRFQSACGLGKACLDTQSFSDNDNTLPDKKEFSYPPQNSSKTTPATLYITVSLKKPSSFSYEANSGFNLTISSK